MSRAVRLKAIETYLYRSSGGRTATEIAARFGIHRSTVYRDVRSLEEGGSPIWEESGRFGVVKDWYLTTVQVNLHETLALYLAARLLSAHSDEHNPQTGETTKRTLDPYFIEPSPVGYACYVIGYDHFRQAICEFKVERIERVELLQTVYETRSEFDPYEFLKQSWGIMGGDEVVDVALRFSAKVRYRVRESGWPGVVEVADEPDGGCTMRLSVKHTLEMKPWIRGWGPECEVLAPEDLRQEIAPT